MLIEMRSQTSVRRPHLLLCLLFLNTSLVSVGLAQRSSAAVRLPIDSANSIARRLTEPLQIEGLKQGNVPVAVRWTEVRIDTAANLLWMAGTVVQTPENIPIAGARLVAGELAPSAEGHRLTTRAGVVADENGEFILFWKPGMNDLLLVTMLGHVEAAWSIGALRKLPAEPSPQK
jgi:hypothetical protein